jgi:hypothetical protein
MVEKSRKKDRIGKEFGSPRCDRMTFPGGLTHTLQLNVLISTLCTSDDLKHKLIAIMGLFLKRSVQDLHLALFRTERLCIFLIVRDGGLERIRVLRSLNAKSWFDLKSPDGNWSE